MQIKKTPSAVGVVRFRANRQLVEANRKVSKEGQVASNKDLVEAAKKVSLDPSKREQAKAANVPKQEEKKTSVVNNKETGAISKRASVCYLDLEAHKKQAEEKFLATKKENTSRILTEPLKNGNDTNEPKNDHSNNTQTDKLAKRLSTSNSEQQNHAKNGLATSNHESGSATTATSSTSGMSMVKLRAKKANKKLSVSNEGPAPLSAKDLVEAAKTLPRVSKKQPVKTGNDEKQDRISSNGGAEEAVKRFSICYMEAQKQEGSNSVACFRSGGAVSIPTRRASTIINTATPRPPPQPRKTSVPETFNLKEASFSVLENFPEEIVEPMGPGYIPPDVIRKANFEVIEVAPLNGKAIENDHPKVTSVARPKAKPKNNCVKHSKCHCVLFSAAVEGFFNIR